MTCSCQKPAPSESAPVTSAVAGLLVEEPLLALAEPVAPIHVAGCGRCPDAADGKAHVTHLRFERASLELDAAGAKTGGLDRTMRTEHLAEEELPRRLRKHYAAPNHCLPWVRITRDPERFRACLTAAQALGPITDSRGVYSLVRDHMSAEDQEVFLVLLLDQQHQIRGISEIARGGRARVEVPVPDTLRIVLVAGTSAFVVVHNHPSGKVRPSDADKELTVTIAKGAAAIGVKFLDHVIVAPTRYHSFRDQGEAPFGRRRAA